MSDFVIYPAIDIRDGRAVRLLRGDMNSETVYGDPLEMALRWQAAGARWLHIVDLDGAIAGIPMNVEPIREILSAVAIPVQLGGGLRNREAVELILATGCERVVLGSAALEDPDWVLKIAEERPGRVVLGLDVRDGKVSIGGWTREVCSIGEAFETLERAKFTAVITTDISRDGAMSGPGLETLATVLETSPWPVIASGGISSLDDIRAIRELRVAGRVAKGAIVGRALYEGRLRLEEIQC